MNDNRFHAYGRGGMVTAPDARASQAGLDVLAEGGNAIEASVAVGAVLAVVCPHMNGIGGDSFWLTAEASRTPKVIDASGGAAAAANMDYFRTQGHDIIPVRGPLAANTVAGTVAGWQTALERSQAWGGRMPLSRLLAPAIAYADEGADVASHLADNSAASWHKLADQPGFVAQFSTVDGTPLPLGYRLRQPALGETLRRIVEAGPADFYSGDIAATLAMELERAGSPISAADLAAYRTRETEPLTLGHSGGRLYNLGAPTQGTASLMILALTDRLGLDFAADDADLVHAMVEATKLAFQRRNRLFGDPAHVDDAFHALLDEAALDRLAASIDMTRAAPADPGVHGDTVWAGVVDGEGRGVSAIHSLFQDFGSGVVLPETGVLWQNRGAAFKLDPAHPGRIGAGARPMHTLNPAMADLADGRRLVYGVQGGDGQPQSQSAIFTRIVAQKRDLGDAVAAPRWLQGRNLGEGADNLKLETGWSEAIADELIRRGHEIEWLPHHSAAFGHGGAITIARDGRLEGAADPRSDGGAAALP